MITMLRCKTCNRTISEEGRIRVNVILKKYDWRRIPGPAFQCDLCAKGISRPGGLKPHTDALDKRERRKKRIVEFY